MKSSIETGMAGAYVQEAHCGPDIAHLVLYLSNTSRLLLVGFWQGYELQVAAEK